MKERHTDAAAAAKESICSDGAIWRLLLELAFTPVLCSIDEVNSVH